MIGFNEDVNWQLEQWGMWSRSDDTGKLTDTCSAMFKDVERASADNDVGIMISDDLGMKIDKYIIFLKKKHIDEYRALMLSYYYNMTDTAIAKREKISRHKVSELLNGAEKFISAKLN